MTILFYSMNGCSFCKKAEQLLEKEIKNGSVVMKSQSEAPAGVNGFPHFTLGNDNSVSHSGLPKSYKELVDKLKPKSVEKYTRSYRRPNTVENFAPNCRRPTRHRLTEVPPEFYGVL